MYFPDLTPYQYWHDKETNEAGLPRVHIGWLDAGKPFCTARPSRGLIKALYQLAQHPVRFARGFHQCWYCRGAEGCAEIDVLGRDIIYAAPILIAHYVESHHYRPPDEFVTAAIEQAEKVGKR